MADAHDRTVQLAALAATECACEGLRRAARVVSKLYSAALAPFGLTATQFAILVALRLRSPVPLSRLAERLTLDRTSLYRTLRPLERRGALRVGPGRTQRERSAALTPQGQRLVGEALPAWERTQQRFADVLGPRAWNALQFALTRIVPLAQAAEPASRASRPRPATRRGGRPH